MTLQRTMTCPSCKGSRCRDSRWLSLDEKTKYPQNRPYRCLDCSHRFLSNKPISFRPRRILAPTAGVLVLLSIAAIYGLAAIESPSPLPAPVPVSALGPKIRIAAEAGDAGAQLTLAESLLQDSTDTPGNSSKAVRWLEMSAENGNTEAMIRLGRMSRTGIGILQNFCNAVRWIHMAAASGDREGMLELGRLYRDGVGVNKDPVRAYVWFNRAAAAHNIEAVREREKIAHTLTAEELREAQRQSAMADSDKPKLAEKRACTG